MNQDSTTVTKDAKARGLRSARLFPSQADTSRAIEYVFGNDYLTTYLNKGSFKVKSVVPRLPWDQPSQPSFSKAQRRSDGILTGNKNHIYSYSYSYLYIKKTDVFQIDSGDEPVRRQSNEEFRSSGRPSCRVRRASRARCNRGTKRLV